MPGENRSLVPPRLPIHGYCVALLGVRGCRHWEDSSGGVVIILQHSWWSWRALRAKNRRRVLVEAYKQYSKQWDITHIEVL